MGFDLDKYHREHFKFEVFMFFAPYFSCCSNWYT